MEGCCGRKPLLVPEVHFWCLLCGEPAHELQGVCVKTLSFYVWYFLEYSESTSSPVVLVFMLH